MTRLSIAAAVLCAATATVFSQAMKQAMQEKLAQVKENMAQNQAALHAYSWTEHTEILHKGEVKNVKDEMCRYGPDGKVQKTLIGGTPQQEEHGLRGHIKEKKIDEMKDYMEHAIAVIHQYVPPSPQKMDAAFQAGNGTISEAGPGAVKLGFTNYVQPGDSMSLTFSQAAKAISQLNVNTYVNDPQDAVTLVVTFQKIPGGPNHAARTVLNAPKKEIQVVSENRNYQRIVGWLGLPGLRFIEAVE